MGAKIVTHFGFIDKGKIVREMSIEELEHDCRKRTHMAVTSAIAASRVLEELGLEHTVLSETEINVFDVIDVTELVMRLAKEDCRVSEITVQEENLESYFMNLIGGRYCDE